MLGIIHSCIVYGCCTHVLRRHSVSDCAIETTLSVVVFSADECIEDRCCVDESIRKGSGTKWRNKTHFNHAQRRRSLGGHFFPLNDIRVCVQNSVLCTVEVLYIQLLMYNGLSRILFVALISLFCSACVRSSLLGKFRRFWCRLVCLLPLMEGPDSDCSCLLWDEDCSILKVISLTSADWLI